MLVPVYLKTPMLKNGETVDLRLYRPEDEEHLVSFYTTLSSETLRWALPPYDRARIERWVSDPEHSIILLALHKEKIVGHLQIFSQPLSRLKGIGELLIYIHQYYQNLGLETWMMEEAIKLARERGLHRVGLTVVADNKHAIKVYEKVGFQHEGVRKEDYFGEDRRYHDVVEMGYVILTGHGQDDQD